MPNNLTTCRVVSQTSVWARIHEHNYGYNGTRVHRHGTWAWVHGHGYMGMGTWAWAHGHGYIGIWVQWYKSKIIVESMIVVISVTDTEMNLHCICHVNRVCFID